MYYMLYFAGVSDIPTMSSSRPQGSADVLRSVPHTRIEDESMIEETYRFGQKLGQGSFGMVREGKCVSSGQPWAIKIINKESKGSFGMVREGKCVSSGQPWAIKIINKESKDSKVSCEVVGTPILFILRLLNQVLLCAS
jgi:serine/threonine kinase 33